MVVQPHETIDSSRGSKIHSALDVRRKLLTGLMNDLVFLQETGFPGDSRAERDAKCNQVKQFLMLVENQYTEMPGGKKMLKAMQRFSKAYGQWNDEPEDLDDPRSPEAAKLRQHFFKRMQYARLALSGAERTHIKVIQGELDLKLIEGVYIGATVLCRSLPEVFSALAKRLSDRN